MLVGLAPGAPSRAAPQGRSWLESYAYASRHAMQAACCVGRLTHLWPRSPPVVFGYDTHEPPQEDGLLTPHDLVKETSSR